MYNLYKDDARCVLVGFLSFAFLIWARCRTIAHNAGFVNVYIYMMVYLGRGSPMINPQTLAIPNTFL